MLLSDIWPYHEIETAPDAAMIPVSEIGKGRIHESVSSIIATKLACDKGVPEASGTQAGYALLLKQQNGVLDVFRLESKCREWMHCARYGACNSENFCVMLECATVLLLGTATDDALKHRVNGLIRNDMKQKLIYQLLSMLTSVASTILIFIAIRIGLGTYAADVFFLLVGFSALCGFMSVQFTLAGQAIHEEALLRVQTQFKYEQQLWGTTSNLTALPIQSVFQKHETLASEITSFGSFAILLGFTFQILPSAAFMTLIAIILSALVLSIKQSTPHLHQTLGSLQMHVVKGLIVLRNTVHTRMVPRRVPNIRRKMLRDHILRYQKAQDRMARETMSNTLLNDLATCLCYVVIIGGFIAGFAYVGVNRGGGLSTVPIIEMAPLLMLFSLSASATKVAAAVSRYSYAWIGHNSEKGI